MQVVRRWVIIGVIPSDKQLHLRGLCGGLIYIHLCEFHSPNLSPAHRAAGCTRAFNLNLIYLGTSSSHAAVTGVGGHVGGIWEDGLGRVGSFVMGARGRGALGRSDNLLSIQRIQARGLIGILRAILLLGLIWGNNDSF